MSLDADYIVDRRRLKRRLLFWRLFAVLSLTVIAVIVALRFETPSFGNYVARLHVSGIIVEDIDRDAALSKLAANSKARALVIRIDTYAHALLKQLSLMDEGIMQDQRK